MKTLTLLLAYSLTFAAVVPQKSDRPEIVALKQVFIELTSEYKASLIKLLPFYENHVKRAQEKVKYSKEQLSQGLTVRAAVEENERVLGLAIEKVDGVKRQIAEADDQIASLPSDEELVKQYERDRAAQRRSAKRSKRCTSWTLVAQQKTTFDSVSFSYKFVCQN